jgi:hypothetical protein
MIAQAASRRGFVKQHAERVFGKAERMATHTCSAVSGALGLPRM